MDKKATEVMVSGEVLKSLDEVFALTSDIVYIRIVKSTGRVEVYSNEKLKRESEALL